MMATPNVLYVHPVGIDAELLDALRNAGFEPDVVSGDERALELMEIRHFAVVIVHPNALHNICFASRAASVTPGVQIVVLSDSSCGPLADIVAADRNAACPIVEAGNHHELITVLSSLVAAPELQTA